MKTTSFPQGTHNMSPRYHRPLSLVPYRYGYTSSEALWSVRTPNKESTDSLYQHINTTGSLQIWNIAGVKHCRRICSAPTLELRIQNTRALIMFNIFLFFNREQSSKYLILQMGITLYTDTSHLFITISRLHPNKSQILI